MKGEPWWHEGLFASLRMDRHARLREDREVSLSACFLIGNGVFLIYAIRFYPCREFPHAGMRTRWDTPMLCASLGSL